MNKSLSAWSAFVLGLLMIAFLAGCGGVSANTPSPTPTPTPTPVPATVVVSIIVDSNGNFAFSPSTITISVGTTVVWKNTTSAPHTVTGNGFGSGTIPSGGTYSFTFTQAGTYAYHCMIHPYMMGTVIVK